MSGGPAPRATGRRAAAACAAAFAFVYLYAFPYFGRLKSANELPRVLMTQEIVERRTFAIDARLPEMGSLYDIATAPDGRHYPNKAPGVSLLAVPVYAAARAVAPSGARDLALSTWLFRVTIVTLPALLFLPVFLGVARRFAPPGAEGAARAALCAYALGSMMLPYALLFVSHATATVTVGTAFAIALRLVRGEARRPAPAAFGIGVLSGLAVLCEYQAAFAAAVVMTYVLARAGRRLRNGAAMAAGAAPPVALLMAIHAVCFGSPFKTGYSFMPHNLHREGWMGLVGPNRTALWDLFLAPDNGLLLMSPWVVLSIVGVVSIARDPAARARIGIEAAVAGAIAVGYLLLVGSLVPSFARGGWSVGPRYVAEAMPFLAWLAAAGFAAVESHPLRRTIACTLVLVGVLVHVLAASTYPHWPSTLSNPLHEVSLRALREGLAPHSLGELVGLAGPLSLAPLYAAVAVLCAGLLRGRERWQWTATATAAMLAGLVVFVAYARFPGSGAEAEDAWRFVRSTWEPTRRGPLRLPIEVSP